MKKRMLLMLSIVIAFIAVIGTAKYLQIRAAMSHGAFQPPPEAVTTVIAKQETWGATLAAIGTATAINGVTVSADAPGIVARIHFDSGRAVQKGDVLVQLDSSQEQAQLAAAQAQLELARLSLQRKAGLLQKAVIPQAMYDEVAAELKQAEARVGEIRAAIERKTIRAPFSGVLGLRQINLGQYLSGGSPIVPLQALRPIYVNFSVPQQEVGWLRVGAPVEVTSDGFQDVETGRVSAINSIVDEATRNIQVQATFDNRSGKLRPGMFVEAHLARGSSTAVIPLPVSAISYAPFGDSVFVVEEMKGPDGKAYTGVRQQFVKLGGARGDQVAVMSGVKPGEEIVTSGVFKLRPSAAVNVNNAIQPGNNPAPTPEDS
ncbi:MAG TPA: efflux RND transporter periplasmic adaptor subunit [Thermoanaerobaculia bacterium]